MKDDKKEPEIKPADRPETLNAALADTPAVETPAEIPAETPAENPVNGTPATVQPQASPAPPDYEELIRQAYLRGRNEAIDQLMRQPAMMQPLDTSSRPVTDKEPMAPEAMILNSPRTSIWEK